MVDTDALRAEKARMIERFGDWTDHNIHLGGDLYTMREEVVFEPAAADRADRRRRGP